MTLSLISIGQTSNDYKDYNPCTTCGPVITNSNKSESNTKSMGVVKKDVINLRPFGRRVKSELKKTTEMVLIATLTIVSTALINLSGGTNAAPSVSGEAFASNLTGKSWSVTTN